MQNIVAVIKTTLIPLWWMGHFHLLVLKSQFCVSYQHEMAADYFSSKFFFVNVWFMARQRGGQINCQINITNFSYLIKLSSKYHSSLQCDFIQIRQFSRFQLTVQKRVKDILSKRETKVVISTQVNILESKYSFFSLLIESLTLIPWMRCTGAPPCCCVYVCSQVGSALADGSSFSG